MNKQLLQASIDYMNKSKRRDNSATNTIYTINAVKKMGFTIVHKKNKIAKIGKSVRRTGVVTLPIPFSGSVFLILIGCGLEVIGNYDKIVLKITKNKRKLAKKIRIFKINVRLY